jgi:hypothetical protein
MKKGAINEVSRLLIGFGFWIAILYLASQNKGCREVPVRNTLGIDTIYQDDSAYVIDRKIDTVYYAPQPPEDDDPR